MTDKIGLRVIFTGNVQGVGFRYRTQRLSARYPVSGYVRNLPNGTVECEIHGEAEDVQTFVQAIQSEMSGNILETQEFIIPFSDTISQFNIRQ